jgi:hypothetical protein
MGVLHAEPSFFFLFFPVMMNGLRIGTVLILFCLTYCKDNGHQPAAGTLQLNEVRIGPYMLSPSNPDQNREAPIDQPIVVRFSASLAVDVVPQAVALKIKNGAASTITFEFSENDKTLTIKPASRLAPNTDYDLVISNQLKGKNRETFPGLTISYHSQ